MQLRNTFIALLIAVGLTCPRSIAIPVPGPNLDKVTEAATLIAIGQASIVEPATRAVTIDWNGSPQTARVGRAALLVDQVLKGDENTGSVTFELLIPDQFLGWSLPPANITGIFFLRKKTEGLFELADRYDSWIQVPRAVTYRGSTPLDRVVSVFADVFSIASSSRSDRIIALRYLESSKSNASTLALRKLLDNPDPVMRVDTARALAYRGDVSGLEVIKRAFQPNAPPLPNDLELTVANCIGIGLRNPALIPQLEELLDSPSRLIRRGTIEALGKTDSAKAVPGLRRGLSDTDFEVRYSAAVGIARMMREGEWVPTLEQFKANESKYLNHWK